MTVSSCIHATEVNTYTNIRTEDCGYKSTTSDKTVNATTPKGGVPTCCILVKTAKSQTTSAVKPKEDFRASLLRTLKYHYLLKIYLPMYRLIYAKQLAKVEHHNQCRLVGKFKRHKLAGGGDLIPEGGRQRNSEVVAQEGGQQKSCVVALEGDSQVKSIVQEDGNKEDSVKERRQQNTRVIIQAQREQWNNQSGRKVVVKHSKKHHRCLILDGNKTMERENDNYITCNHKHNREHGYRHLQTDVMNNKVVHFALHATVLHFGPEEDSGCVNDNWIYNNSQYLRASHPLDNINLNEDDSDSDDDDDDESTIQCRCYFPQCTHICTDPQCTHTHAQLRPTRILSPCSQTRKGNCLRTDQVTVTNCICPGINAKPSKPIPGRCHSQECIMFQSRRTDREEIRRKLAMGGDEDYYGGERAFKKPNLQTRLQHAMNLQICFMNPDTPAAPNAAPTDPAADITQVRKAL